MADEFRGLNVLENRRCSIAVEDGKVVRIAPDDKTDDNLFICPGGLVDTQVNGYLGYDYSEKAFESEHALKISEALAKAGTLQHFATIVTSPQERIVRNIDLIVKAVEEYEPVRRSLTGIHVEGNFISHLDGPRGAHDPLYVRKASIEEFDQWYDHSKGLLKYITVGAEAEGVIPLIKHAVEKGVVVSLGHTGATAEQIDAAAEAGATACTHLGNGTFSALDRFNNPLWPQMRNQKLTAGIIADGCHVDPDLLWIFSRCKDPDNIILVTDLSQCAGLPVGRRMWGNILVDIVEDGSVRLAGTPYLAGAGSQLLRDVWNYSRFTGTDFVSAFRLATVNPIRKYSLDSSRARIEEGKKAEFVVFEKTDEGCVLKAVFADGRRIV